MTIRSAQTKEYNDLQDVVDMFGDQTFEPAGDTRRQYREWYDHSRYFGSTPEEARVFALRMITER